MVRKNKNQNQNQEGSGGAVAGIAAAAAIAAVGTWLYSKYKAKKENSSEETPMSQEEIWNKYHPATVQEDTSPQNPQDMLPQEEEEKQPSDIHIPKSMITCPLTGKLMTDPVCVNG